MDAVTIIILLIILVLIIVNNSNLNQRIREFDSRITDLQNLLRQRELPKPEAKPPVSEWQPKSVQPAVVAPPPPPKPIEVKSPTPPPPVEVKLPEPAKPAAETPAQVVEKQKEVIADPFATIRQPVKTSDQAPPVFKPRPVETPQPSFGERYPDLEKFIGENLVNKIGIAILVLAIGFFVKYAIDQNWIGAGGRVGIGILCGGILVALAHWLRKNYKAFSSVMAGGGIAVFYFSITLAFQEFHLFSQFTALCIMIVITLFAVALALLYDKQELAVIALVGGMASPFLLSTGTANYNGLFIYLLVLNAGLLVIAYFKAWRVLNISSFGLSVIVVATIIYSLNTPDYYIGLRYATLFYLLFFTINIINNIRENKNFLAIDFSILLINTALYFGAGLYLLTAMGQTEYRGLFSAALAGINLVLSFILFRKKTVDPNILYLLIGITLTFISLTAPIQLHGNNITLFWASETVLLYWLHLKSSVKLMKLTALLVWGATIISLLGDISAVYVRADIHFNIIANKGFITILFASVSSYVLYLLVKRDPVPEIYGMAIRKNLFRIIAIILLFLAGLLEVNHQVAYYYPDTQLNILYLMLYVPLFVYLFHIISAWVNAAGYSWVLVLTLFCCTVFIYLALSQVYFNQLQQMLELKKVSTSHFRVHWISDLVILLLFYGIIRLEKAHVPGAANAPSAWLLVAAIVAFFSLEICLLSELLFFSKQNTVAIIQNVYIKTALPVLWGVLSFMLMWLGMRNKQRNLRIMSLTLFTITLIKLFAYDIVDIPVGGKIAAFFCLGVLLLIVSFMYQKVKKIIADDGEKAKHE